jgi:hypothetical protein
MVYTFFLGDILDEWYFEILDTMEKKLLTIRDSNSSVSVDKPVVSRCTDCAAVPLLMYWCPLYAYLDCSKCSGTSA